MKSFDSSSRATTSRANAAVQRVSQPTKPFIDNRPTAVAQRKLQANVNSQAQVVQRRLPLFSQVKPHLAGDSAEARNAEKKLKQSILYNFGKLDQPQQDAVKDAFNHLHPTQDWDRLFTLKPDPGQELTDAEKDLLGDIINLIKVNSGKLESEIIYEPFIEKTAPVAMTTQADNLDAMVADARRLMDAIATGNHDDKLYEVFGEYDPFIRVWGMSGKEWYIKEAKEVFKQASDALERLRVNSQIVIDAGGYGKATKAGGLTGKDSMILPDGFFDSYDPATDKKKIITLIHESTHAIDNATTDDYYKDHTPNSSFLVAKQDEKIKLAPHYEEVARRILKPHKTYPPFTPGEKAASAKMSDAQNEVEKAVTRAWTVAIGISNTLMSHADFLRNPAKRDKLKQEHKDEVHTHLINLSKLLGLTMHKKSRPGTESIEPTSLDLALAEERAFQLAKFLKQAKTISVPDTETDPVTYILNQLIQANGGRTRQSNAKEIQVIKLLAESYDKGRANYFKTRTLP